MKIIQFKKLAECVAYIRSVGKISIYGVEIDEKAIDVESTDDCFNSHIAFMMGNEGEGLNQKQRGISDRFVKICQYGSGTASLNVNVAASIVLHRFHEWSKSQDLDKSCK
mmetsp:Transcript_2038/g.2897  ORF Transcript_2038/g.2897 Transcript_2038/m.2897 type:complete len:110 (-) Transcript_2038:195-524(-)